MDTFPLAILAAIITAVLGYLAGLHRDNRTEQLQRERDRLREVETAAMDVIEGCRVALGATLASLHMKKRIPELERKLEDEIPTVARSERKALREAVDKEREVNRDQSADAFRQINRAVIKLRIIAPELVAGALELRDMVNDATVEDLQRKPFDAFDSQADAFARSTQAHLSKPRRRKPTKVGSAMAK